MSMSNVRDEARHALGAVASAQSGLKQEIHYGRSGPYLVAWGAVWLGGFTASFVWPERLAVIWPVATALGWAATMALVVRQGRTAGADGTLALKYAASAAVLSVFAIVWPFLLMSDHPSRVPVYAGTMVGCAYMLAGVWRGRLLVLIGAAVAVLFLAGLSLDPTWFPLYAAAIGGSALIGSGLLLARRDPL